MGPCEEGRLGIMNKTEDYLGIQSYYLCPQDYNYTVQGSFSGETTKFIQIAARECNQKVLDAKYNKTQKCAETHEMLRVAAQLKLYLIV